MIYACSGAKLQTKQKSKREPNHITVESRIGCLKYWLWTEIALDKCGCVDFLFRFVCCFVEEDLKKQAIS